MKNLNMHKAGILTVTLAAGLAGAAQAQSAPQIFLDGHPFRTSASAFTQDGRVLVPLRGIFEGLGADVRFNDADGTIVARRGDTEVRMRLGSNRARVNEQPVSLDVAATAYDGRTFVPLRFVSEALGAAVDYNYRTQVVSIHDGDHHGDHHDGPRGDRPHDGGHDHDGPMGGGRPDDGRTHGDNAPHGDDAPR